MAKLVIIIEAETTDDYDQAVREAAVLRLKTNRDERRPADLLGEHIANMIGGLLYIQTDGVEVRVNTVVSEHHSKKEVAAGDDEAIPSIIDDHPSEKRRAG